MAEMHVPARLPSIRPQTGAVARGLVAASVCVLVSGCITEPFRDAKVDPTSPVAAEVARVAHVNKAYPSFASIPAAPKDLRPPRRYGQAAQAVEQASADLEQKTAPETWSLTNTEGFAAAARSEAGSEPPPKASGDTAAFANTQRKRATPPPPPHE